MTDRQTDHPDVLYKRHRFPAEIISHAVWFYFRFPLSLRHVEDMLADRGIAASRFPSRLSPNGHASSVAHMHGASDGYPGVASPTNGTSMRW
jgi:hypothetical protein